MAAIVWFRRDLRVRDHPALRRALAEHERVLPVFCLDDRLLLGRHASGPRTRFMLESLADLDASLRERAIGTDYPAPIVDHREAREEALARYRSAMAGARADTSRL